MEILIGNTEIHQPRVNAKLENCTKYHYLPEVKYIKLSDAVMGNSR